MNNIEFIELLGICGKTEGIGQNTFIRLKKLKKWEENIEGIFVFLDKKKVDIDTISIYLDLIRIKRFDLKECNEIVIEYFKKFENMLNIKDGVRILKAMLRSLRISNTVLDFEENLRYYLEFKVGAR